MSNVVVRVEEVAKRYQIGQHERYQTLRESLTLAAQRPFRRLANALSAQKQPRQDAHIWALRDVSFELQRGEILGIIGRNGAGKSTLLKILSRITMPTSGLVKIRGRVGSLLEVGTGFHPELTGRENIYLNGAILGMKKAEIARKFDEIVAFSEVEKFLDTPVKRYSSGMYVRLAFAVAAHLEPDILVVDEVLAVGDAAFQKKCLSKMQNVGQGGRTVLFVSHNMTAIQSLCNHLLWLEQGQVVESGQPEAIVSHYLQTSFSSQTNHLWTTPESAPGNEKVRIRRATVRPSNGTAHDTITVRTPVALEFEYWNLQPDAYLNLSLHIYNEQGMMVFNALPVKERRWQGHPFPAGLFQDTCFVPGDLLNDGMYSVELLIVRDETEVIYRHDEILIFDVQDDATWRGAWHGKWPGAVRPLFEWQTKLIKEGL